MAKLAKVLEGARRTLTYLAETAVLDFTIDLERIMKRKGVNRAELGRRIGSSQAYVSQVLSGQRNLTIKSMALLAHALECRVHVAIEPLHVSALQQTWERVGTANPYAKVSAVHSRLEVSLSRDVLGAANDEWLTVKAA